MKTVRCATERRTLALVLIAALCFVGCGDDDETNTSETNPETADLSCAGETLFADQTFELAGLWNDNYGSWTIVDDSAWGADAVRQFDNDANWAIIQSPEDNEYTPNQYSKVVWLDPDADGVWWMCTAALGLDTLDEAIAAENASDEHDLEMAGCNGFPWTRYESRAALTTAGVWQDNYGEETKITSAAWGSSRVIDYNNEEAWAIVQSPADDEYTANQFSYVVWTEIDAAGTWANCTVAFGIDDLDEARMTENTADESDLSGEGCNGFPWTIMSCQQ